MAFDSKITNADLTDKGVTGLPDVPNLTILQMQQKFDELCKDVIIPKFNALINELESDGSFEIFGTKETGASKIGAKDGTLLSTVQDCLDALKELAHSHDNKDALGDVTSEMITSIERLSTMLEDITAVSTSVSNSDALIPTCKAIVDYVQVLGTGDMLKAVYDADNDGIVDNAEALNGHDDTYFQKATDNTLATTDKTTTGAINEVKANVGDLSDLDTTDKTDLVSAVNEVKASAYPMIANETELMANTQSGKVADSLIVKQLNSNLNSWLDDIEVKYDDISDKPMYRQRGADTWLPFKGNPTIEIVNSTASSTVHTFATEPYAIYTHRKSSDYFTKYEDGIITRISGEYDMITKVSDTQFKFGYGVINDTYSVVVFVD